MTNTNIIIHNLICLINGLGASGKRGNQEFRSKGIRAASSNFRTVSNNCDTSTISPKNKKGQIARDRVLSVLFYFPIILFSQC